jgi:4-alpha-glucanotransferase
MTNSPSARTGGLLLHPTSLPGPYGIGDLGPACRAWIDLLESAGQTWWQVLPLNPPGAGDSPYSAFSAFAGNPLLVSPDDLAADGLLRKDECTAARLPDGRVDYPRAASNKDRLLTRAWERFRSGEAPALRGEFEEFIASTPWLEDYAHFMAIKETMPDRSWTDWPKELVALEPAALARSRKELADGIDRHRFLQFAFFRQLTAARSYAAERNVKMLGDMPIFVSGDSADVWVNPHLFSLGEDRRPRFVAGVPPDFFSETGQRWGNPHYDWAAMEREGFAWWIARVRATLAQVDAVRIDHFRGFEAYWEIPAECPTAEQGRWVEAPGYALFEALRAALLEDMPVEAVADGSEKPTARPLPLVAEDLGIITPAVEELRARFGLPGMRVLQFAFGGAVEERFLPHGFERNVLAYTGTHDNDTTLGWYNTLTELERTRFQRYAPEARSEPVWALIRLAWASVADTAIAPLQDVLGLGTEARMNIPGKADGNWNWRVAASQLEGDRFERLGELTETYGRKPPAEDRDALDEPEA